MVSHYYALHLFEGINVSLNRIIITNSTQIGLLCFNLLGTSHIRDSVFTYSNYRLLEDYMHGKVNCSADELECVGKNVWVVFVDDSYANYTKFEFTIEGTEISYGVNLSPDPLLFTQSAGVGIMLMPQLRHGVHHRRIINLIVI